MRSSTTYVGLFAQIYKSLVPSLLAGNRTVQLNDVSKALKQNQKKMNKNHSESQILAQRVLKEGGVEAEEEVTKEEENLDIKITSIAITVEKLVLCKFLEMRD